MTKDLGEIFKDKSLVKGNLISVILPVYNEEDSLRVVVDELYDKLGQNFPEYKFEITFIDDCSKDNSFKVLSEISNNSPDNIKVSVVKLAKNTGSHIAITAGLNLSRGSFTIIMASDGQDPPEVIGELISEWKKGNNIVLASRLDNLDHSFISKILSNLAWKLMKWSTEVPMPEKGCDLLGIDKKVLDAFNKMDERNTTFIFRILSLGYKVKEIEYIKRGRIAGRTSWTLMKKLSIMFDAISGYSSRPLRLITKAGFLLFIILVIRWLVIILGIYIFKKQPTELSIILNTIFTSLSIQVLLLGFIGDYIWRILDETRKRPLYEISEIEGKIFGEL